jgi:hypothetical protein
VFFSHVEVLAFAGDIQPPLLLWAITQRVTVPSASADTSTVEAVPALTEELYPAAFEQSVPETAMY